MRRFFITLAYNGKNYAGWQIQPNGISVQQKVQEALSVLLRKQISIVGAGRTDAGVHAEKMVAHFDWEGDSFNIQHLILRLNGFLPNDIAINDIYEVTPDAHARFSAISRTYHYYVTTQKNPFFYEFEYRIFFEPNMLLMNKLCDILKECVDFTSFCKVHSNVKTHTCHIETAFWEKRDNRYVFTITADRFLRNMVRAIVGTLLEAGRGRMNEDDFRRIIEAKDRRHAGTSAPAYALFLHDIVYLSTIRLGTK